jgi:hypothetical protein
VQWGGGVEFAGISTIDAAMQRFCPSESGDCSVCVVQRDDHETPWSIVVPIVRRFFAPIFLIESMETTEALASDARDEKSATRRRLAAPVMACDWSLHLHGSRVSDDDRVLELRRALAAGTSNEACVARVVDELARRFSLDRKRASAIAFLANGGARNALSSALSVGDDRVRQIVASIHRHLRTSRVDEIAHEVLLATLRGRSAFYLREPHGETRRARC